MERELESYIRKGGKLSPGSWREPGMDDELDRYMNSDKWREPKPR